MKLVEINWRPSDSQLRQFGILSLIALPAIGWLWGAGNTVLGMLTATGILFASIGLVIPSLLKPVFLTLSMAAMPVGLVIGELAILTIYFGIFLPLGLIFRLIGRDALQRQVDRSCDSYWERKGRPANVASYYRQS